MYCPASRADSFLLCSLGSLLWVEIHCVVDGSWIKASFNPWKRSLSHTCTVVNPANTKEETYASRETKHWFLIGMQA